MIWGLSFVAQKSGSGTIDSFTFNATRFAIGTLVLLPVLALKNRKPSEDGLPAPSKKTYVIAGICCGFCLFAGTALQQEAFTYLEAGKVGFVTALYMILVPVFGLFIGKKAGINAWVGVVLGAVGLYLICIKPGKASLGKGDIITIIGAVCFALHILCVDRFVTKVDALKLSTLQFFVAFIFSAVAMAIFEKPTLEAIRSAWVPIIYCGVMSSGVAFTFQTYGQKYTEPAIASLLLCLESAFSLLFGWLILHENLGKRALIGCAVMMVAVILTQIDFKTFRKNKEGA